MTTSGSGYYQDTPGIRFIPPNGAVITSVASGSLITNGSSIMSITVIDAGQGYQPIPSTVSVITQTGAGAELLPVINSAGSLISINVQSPGLGYTTQDTIVINRAVVFDENYIDAVARISAVSFAGEILALSVINPGSGYQASVTTVEVVSSLSPSRPYPIGTGFTASVYTNISGAITGAVVTNPGAGYAVYPPYLVISDVGSGAITRVTVNDQTQISAIEVIAPGRNYTADATGVVYNPPTAAEPNPPIDSASVSIKVSNNTYGTDPGLYYRVWAGLETNKAIQLQINAVVSYFKSLGYTVTIQSNPGNTNTIQWQIGW